ncbi:MAG: RNA polymerase sigma factor [Gemmatimonadota bacterium]
MDETDEALIKRVLAGETDLYARLLERYRQRLARYAVRMLGSEADAEDVLQETFVRGYRSLARCQPDRFRYWLFGILINRCRTFASQRSRRQSVISSNDYVVASVSTRYMDDQYEWRQAIAWAMTRLPTDQREAFLLKHVEDLSYEEMQELTGVRIPALKMRVFRAREELRRLLVEKVIG